MSHQTSEILQQKITLPPSPPHTISRKTLMKDLNDQFRRENSYPQVVLITAPAGYGKTTFANEWLASLDRPVLWFSIDENDNDLHRYLTYLIHTLRQQFPTLGKVSLDMLSRYSALSEGGFSSETLLTPIMNELYRLSEPVSLVLDDYHQIDDSKIHQAMIFFLSNLPGSITPVVLSRSEPPWPLHQWRAKNQLLEVTEKHLRLSREETDTYLREIAIITPGEEDLKTLAEKTEGWVTALQLLTASLGETGEMQDLIRNLSGDHQKILPYLTEEILHRQSGDVQRFLLKTSQLSRFTPELCNAILDREDSQQVIEQLMKENLFLIPLDHRGRWYRYHPLFRDTLIHHFRRENPSSDNQLFRIAGQWFENEGDPAEAIRSYSRGNDPKSVARILEGSIEYLWETEGFTQVLKWQDQLPDELQNRSLKLIAYKGYTSLLAGDIPATTACFAAAEKVEDRSDQEALGILETLKTTYHLFSGNLEQGFISAKKALTLLPEDSYFWRISGAVVYGDVKVFSGDLAGAYEVYRDAYRWSRKSGNALSTVTVALNLLKVLWMKGDLHKARRLAEETLKIAKMEGYSDLPRIGAVWVFLGEFLREEGNLVESGRCANRGLALCEPERILYGMCCIFLTNLSLSKKEYDEGFEYLGRLESMQRESILPDMVFHLMNSYKSRLYIGKDETHIALELLNVANLEDLTTIFFPCSPPLIHTRLLLLEHQLEEAERFINHLKDLPQYHSSRKLMIDLLLMEAHLHSLAGNDKVAEEKVIKGMKMGKGYGFYQTFLDEGRFVYPLFQRLIHFGDQHKELERDPGLFSYLKNLGRGLGLDCRSHNEADEVESRGKSVQLKEKTISSESDNSEVLHYQDFVEELTDRELEILKAISQGLTNMDISNSMFLSIHTVKWHNKNLFGKLGVSNRTQAVVRGRELQLIP